MQFTMKSPNGIEVMVTVEIGSSASGGKERITLEPLTQNMMAFPPEGELFDGETKEFVIMGGMS
jgi:hypothetical protein